MVSAILLPYIQEVLPINPPESPISAASPPRWVSLWLGTLPALYLIVPLCILALPVLRRLPKVVLTVLLGYALTQQLAALFTPEPLLASVLALLRTALLLGLLGLGVMLRRSASLWPLCFGLMAVYLTAIGEAAPALAGVLFAPPVDRQVERRPLGQRGRARIVLGPGEFRPPVGVDGRALRVQAEGVGGALGFEYPEGDRFAHGAYGGMFGEMRWDEGCSVVIWL